MPRRLEVSPLNPAWVTIAGYLHDRINELHLALEHNRGSHEDMLRAQGRLAEIRALIDMVEPDIPDPDRTSTGPRY